MSLINDALKKAQHLRTAAPAGETATGAPGEARIPRRGPAHSANSMVLLGSAALVLVVLSVVVTVVLVNQPQKPKAPVATVAAPTPALSPAATAATTAPSPAPESTPPAPSTSAPIITVPIASAPVVLNPPPASVAAQPTPVATPPVSSPPTATVASTAPASPTPPAPTAPTAATSNPGPALPDERVASFVEAVRVTGIRSFGTDSRVLMNERVYRVNDLVERTLGVRLTAVKAESLTFTDANGVTYVKNF